MDLTYSDYSLYIKDSTVKTMTYLLLRIAEIEALKKYYTMKDGTTSIYRK